MIQGDIQTEIQEILLKYAKLSHVPIEKRLYYYHFEAVDFYDAISELEELVKRLKRKKEK